MPEEDAYTLGKISIKKNKIDDIAKIMPYILAEHQEFYNDIIQWPTTHETSAEENE